MKYQIILFIGFHHLSLLSFVHERNLDGPYYRDGLRILPVDDEENSADNSYGYRSLDYYSQDPAKWYE